MMDKQSKVVSNKENEKTKKTKVWLTLLEFYQVFMSKAGTYSNQGDDYQRAVAINWIIKLVTDDTIEYVQVESNGLLGIKEKVPVDDIVVVYKDGRRRHIQAKKNQTQERAWSIKDWGSELPKILSQLEQGEHIFVELYSSTALGEFKTLSRECQNYPNFDDFRVQLSIANKKALSVLVKEWKRSEDEIFKLLKRLCSGSQHTTEEWRNVNKDSLRRIVTNPLLALDTLEAFVNRHQSKDLAKGMEIRLKDVLDELRSKGLTKLPSFSEEEIINQFQRTSAIGRNDWKRTIVGKKIRREELGDVLKHIQDRKSTILVQDRPGSGKTCLLLDLADAIEGDNERQLLFIKGDRFTKMTSSDSFLPNEIVESCGLLSYSSHVVVVIDSLDVLSCQRDHAALSFFLKLIDQLRIIKNVTVVAACREFDLKYDPRLRDRTWDVEIKLQDFDFIRIVVPILEGLNINIEQLNSDLKKLLCLPQHLSLFENVSGCNGVFDVRTTYDLYNAYINYSLRQDAEIEEHIFKKSIFSIIEKLLREREHSLPKTILNVSEDILHRLVSKGILNEDANGKLGFSHQTLFDNFVAANALQNGVSLSALILEYPALPFYRPFVRSYLFFVRSQSCKTFSRNVRDTLLDENIAYHFKRLVVETYAEMIPINGDWNLVRWMFLNKPDFFKRFFWNLKSSHWFELIANKWYPYLSCRPDKYEWCSIFIRKLDTWMNVYPAETVEIWNNALNEDWGKDNIWVICHDLLRFEHYHIDGVKDLVYALRSSNNADSHFMGNIYCHYIDATGDGYEILWEWMTNNISIKEINTRNEKNELRCERHDLNNGGFLKEHLRHSEEFLSLVLKSLLNWVENSYYLGEDGLTHKLLEYTSVSDRISRIGSLRIDNISILIEAIEEAFLYHARINSEWWKKKEGQLRSCNELAIRYILIKGYGEKIESNLDGVTAQLLDKELFESGYLNYELGLLINETFHLLLEQTQNKIVQVIESLFSEHTEQEENFKSWYNRVKFELFIRIPACYRSSCVSHFIDKFIPQFGYCLPCRKINARGGIVGSPVSAENIDNLSIEGLYKLFSYYKDYSGFSFHPADGASGGMQELSRTISGLAKNNPNKYLEIVNNPKFNEFSNSISKAILEGIGSHISCRMGKVNDNDFNPVSPLPDVNSIACHLLDAIELHHVSFPNDITYVRMVKNCIDALPTQMHLKRIIKLLMPLSSYSGLCDIILDRRSIDGNKVTVDDIEIKSMNCTRGIVGESALKVLNRLLDLDIKPFEAIIVLVERMAVDKEQEVRGALLWDLAYTVYKNQELAWQIFNLIFNKKQVYLWGLAERFLYNQYYENFAMVKPCLDRIKNEAIDDIGATWGRLSALCMIQGHVCQEEFFKELKKIDKRDVWGGALSVFIANLERKSDGLCQESFRKFIKEHKARKEYANEIDRAFRLDEKGKFINDVTGKLFINALNLDEDKSPKMHFFIEWIEYQATINPMTALEICESLLSKLQSCESKPRLWHSKPLISTLTRVLREADEMDDPELINRAVRLQDQYLLLEIDGMDEYFDKATLL
ncbi:ATP-binding protein [Puteibacter caeruleilacunae]|nr:ATP-binding protein [Puteibacter caeruleilacunae]